MRKTILIVLIIFIAVCLAAFLLYRSPAVQETIGWRLQALKADVQYALNPPQQAVFLPQEQGAAPASETPTPALLPSASPTIILQTPVPTETPTLAPTPTLTPTPLPAQATLGGILHMYQMWNNCGPANLAMALTYWGWKGDQRDPAAFLKPNKRDKNVMPYEMEAYIDQETDYQAVLRVGGEVDQIKAFLAAGFPVIVEKGFEGVGFDGWMGHYQVVNGYNDASQEFIVQDSYKGPDLPITYQDFISNWRAFNYTYLVIYPEDRRQQVLDILGLQAYDNFNDHYAEQKAQNDIAALTGRDLFFALFNRGASLVALQDYTNAAQAFDAAFANYAQLTEAERPWRMMWYQTGPYFAYYYTGRYQDIIDLATTTLDASSEPIMEESYYWRARALIALGDTETAITDLQACLEAHPDFTPCLEELDKLGVQP
jgi:hypothetical protein